MDYEVLLPDFWTSAACRRMILLALRPSLLCRHDGRGRAPDGGDRFIIAGFGNATSTRRGSIAAKTASCYMDMALGAPRLNTQSL